MHLEDTNTVDIHLPLSNYSSRWLLSSGAVQNAIEYGIERQDLQLFETWTTKMTMTATITWVAVALESSIERDFDRFRTLFATGKVALCIKGLGDDEESTHRVSSLSIDLNVFQTLRAIGKLIQIHHTFRI
jgi:hypothetical protein